MTSTVAVLGDRRADRRLGVGRLVADELGGKAGLARQRGGPLTQPVAAPLAAGPLARPRALVVHQRLEAGLVDAEPMLGDDLERQVDREAVGVVQQERVGGGDSLVVVLARLGDQLVQALETLLQRAAEALLLGGQPAADQRRAARCSSGYSEPISSVTTSA